MFMFPMRTSSSFKSAAMKKEVLGNQHSYVENLRSSKIVAKRIKIAIVHDWLVSPGGAEKVLYELHKLYPYAPIYTSAYIPEKFPEFKNADVRTTWVDKISFFKNHQQLGTLPRACAFLNLDLSEYDVVISSSSAESKYARTGKKTLHICYCHTPVRYYWSDYDWYRQHPPFGKILNWLAKNIVLPLLIKPLRVLDYNRARKVNLFIANSENIRGRIKKYYKQDSIVIYPPVKTKLFQRRRSVADYYVIIGRHVAYKRLDLAVAAFNSLGYKLKVAGTGEEMEVQRRIAGKNIEFLGKISEEEKAKLLSEAKAFIFPTEEDFGITPVEAMSAGCPVIALGRGGALEYVQDGESGILFPEQTKESLITAVRKFENMNFDENVVRNAANKFDEKLFAEKMSDFVDCSCRQFTNSIKNGKFF